MENSNKHLKTIEGFGDEWQRFNQKELDKLEAEKLFEKYFYIFPWSEIPANAVGFDMGCGSGRWAKFVSERVGLLHCIDPSSAIKVAKDNLKHHENIIFHQAHVGDVVLPLGTMDFGYSLGVLHHIPNTAQGIRDCVLMLKYDAPFLIYLYYALDNRPKYYKCLWYFSDLMRKKISLLPLSLRYCMAQLIAMFIYWPLARLSFIIEKFNLSQSIIDLIPLSYYRNLSFYTMRTDALDRFGTQLEHRYTKLQIQTMMEDAGLCRIEFSENSPFWVAVGRRCS